MGAFGAAVAVTLGAGIVPVARAVVGAGERSVFVPITPCRLIDTRGGATTVGPRSTPIREGEAHEVVVHGSNGRCTIPTSATAIATNTTVANGTHASFLSVYPAGGTRPQASSLNWVAGQPPTPNQVTVKLSTQGRILVYNDRGSVNVLMDVVGYFAPQADPGPNYLMLSGHDFAPTSSDVHYMIVGSSIRATQLPIGGFTFVTALHLPHGAAISEITAYVRDNHATNVNVSLWSYTPATSFVGTPLRTGFSVGASLDIQAVTLAFDPPLVVDNITTTYHLAIGLGVASVNQSVTGVRITYTPG